MEKNIFMTEKEIEEISTKENKNGIPFKLKNEKRTITNNYNTLVISEDKEQKNKMIEALINNISNTKETIIINSSNKTIYEKTKEKIEKQGYEIVEINIENPKEGYNPLELPLNLYKKGKIDDAIEQLNNIGYSIFYENTNLDPFWQNMAMNLFNGIILYLIEKQETIALKKINDTCNNIKKEDLNEKNKSYIYLSNIINAPSDTKGSIITVFKQKLNNYIINETRNKMFEKTTFDINNLKNKAIFIITGMAEISESLVPIIIEQIFNLSRNNDEKINIILDEIDSIKPIRNFNKMINISKNINYTIITKNYTTLKNTYEKNFEELKVNFKNTLYLYSEDFETLKEISKMCENIEIDFLKRIEEDKIILITIRKKPMLLNI